MNKSVSYDLWRRECVNFLSNMWAAVYSRPVNYSPQTRPVYSGILFVGNHYSKLLTPDSGHIPA